MPRAKGALVSGEAFRFRRWVQAIVLESGARAPGQSRGGLHRRGGARRLRPGRGRYSSHTGARRSRRQGQTHRGRSDRAAGLRLRQGGAGGRPGGAPGSSSGAETPTTPGASCATTWFGCSVRRFYFVEWPEGVKDANDMLLSDGLEELGDLVQNGYLPWPVEDIHRLSALP